MTDNEMVGWLHRLSGHELGQTLEDGEGQGSLACCSPWGHKESVTTWQLNQPNRPYDPVILFLGMEPRELKPGTRREICTTTFTHSSIIHRCPK